jgi:tRNA threonylcarbamoyladenosine biosynthesis protein TsaE
MSSLQKLERAYSESELQEDLVPKLLRLLRPGLVVLLEGEMGAGKSTLARLLLEALRVERPSEGSPTFAICHEYNAPGFPRIAHVDLYRLRQENEIEEAGINDLVWRPEVVSLIEWASLFPDWTRSLANTLPVLKIELRHQEDPMRRWVSVSWSGEPENQKRSQSTSKRAGRGPKKK